MNISWGEIQKDELALREAFRSIAMRVSNDDFKLVFDKFQSLRRDNIAHIASIASKTSHIAKLYILARKHGICIDDILYKPDETLEEFMQKVKEPTGIREEK